MNWLVIILLLLAILFFVVQNADTGRLPTRSNRPPRMRNWRH